MFTKGINSKFKRNMKLVDQVIKSCEARGPLPYVYVKTCHFIKYNKQKALITTHVFTNKKRPPLNENSLVFPTKEKNQISAGKVREGLNLEVRFRQNYCDAQCQNKCLPVDLFFTSYTSNADGVLLNQVNSCIDYDP